MREYDGAVLFVDILGINTLTTAKSQLVTEADFLALGWPRATSISNQYFCAALLSTFRRNLMACRTAVIKIAQLSDCAFIWSADLDAVVEAARKLFWLNAKAGVLTRGGMTYGQIVEPDTIAHSLGQFICGEAVTRAAGLEKAGKGARIFVDTQLPGRRLANVSPESFSALRNASDFQVVDEFAWFSLPRGDEKHVGASSTTMTAMFQLVALFPHSPKYRWNAASQLGLLQIGATVERMGMEMRRVGERYGLDVPEAALVRSDTLIQLHELPDPTERSDSRVSSFLKQNKRKRLSSKAPGKRVRQAQ